MMPFVDVVCDAARHLPQRPEALLLHDGLLRLPQIVVCPFQPRVQLRLMCRQRRVLAQLAHELAFTAAECVRLATARR